MKISTILFFCLLMTACMQTKSFHRTNGWYYVTSQTTDSLSQTPFLTVMDFDSLRLETDAFGHSVITGVFLQDKLPIWREATTKSVGKYIAFVFNDTVNYRTVTFRCNPYYHRQPAEITKLRLQSTDKVYVFS